MVLLDNHIIFYTDFLKNITQDKMQSVMQKTSITALSSTEFIRKGRRGYVVNNCVRCLG